MTTFSRRDALALLGAAGTGFAGRPPAARAGAARRQPAGAGLGEIAARRGLRYGSAVGTAQLGDPDDLAIVRRECGVVVAENAQKMYAILPEPDDWQFSGADALARFAEENGIGLRGHALLWNHPNYLPDWVMRTEFEDAGAAETFLRGYIGRVASRYAPQIYAWDVVNETIDPETGALRDTPFTRALGPAVIDIAFDAARQAAPGAALAYNDYMGWPAGDESHRTAVLRLLERLQAGGVPIDGLGIQAHAKWTDRKAEFSPARQKEWRTFLDEVTGMGLDLYVTELDVNDGDATGTNAERDAEIAAYTRDYLDLMLSYPQTKDVLTWGLVDEDSWLQAFVDGTERPRRPLPFAEDHSAKPMRAAMAAAFENAPDRS